MRRIAFGLVVVIAALVQVGEAQDQSRSLTAAGLPRIPAARSEPPPAREKTGTSGRLLGFVSGAGFIADDALAKTDPAGIKSWIDRLLR